MIRQLFLTLALTAVSTVAFAGEWYEDALTAGFRRVPDVEVFWNGKTNHPSRVSIGVNPWYNRVVGFDLSCPTQYFGKTIAIAFMGRGNGQIDLEYEWTKRAKTIHSVISPTFPDKDMPYRVIYGPVPSNKVVRVHVKTTGTADITYPVFLASETAPVPNAQESLPNKTQPSGPWPKGYVEGRRIPLPPGEIDLAPLAETWSFGMMSSRLGQATDGSFGTLERKPFVLSFPQPVTVTGFRWTLPPKVADVWADTTGDGQYDMLLYRNWNGYSFSTWKNLQEYVWLCERFPEPVKVHKVFLTAGAHEFELTGPASEAAKLPCPVSLAPASRSLAVGAPLAKQPEAPSVDDQYWYGFCLEPWMFGMEGKMADFYKKGTPPGEIADWSGWQKIAADFHTLNANFVLLFPPQTWRMPSDVKSRGTYPYPLMWPSDVWYCSQTNDLLSSFNRACHQEDFKSFVIPREWLFKTNETAEAKQVTFAREIAQGKSDGVPVCIDEHFLSARSAVKTEVQKAEFLKWSGLEKFPSGIRDDKATRLLYLYGAKHIAGWMADIKKVQLEANPDAVTFGGFAGCDVLQSRVTGSMSGADFWGWEGQCDVIGGDGTYFGVGGEAKGVNLCSMVPYVETAVQVSCTPKRRSMATINFNWGIRWDAREGVLKNPLVQDDFPPMAQKAAALASYFAKGEFVDFWRYNFMDELNGPAYRKGIAEGGYMTKVLGSWGGKKAEVPKDVLILRSRPSEDWWFLRNANPVKAGFRTEVANWGFHLFFWASARLAERGTPFEIYQLQRVDAWKDIAANYKVIVLPFAFSLSDEESAALKAAAEKGVKIVLLGGEEAGAVDGIGEPREQNGFEGIPVERFEIADPMLPATRAQAEQFDKFLRRILPQPSLAIEKNANHDVQAYMLSVSEREKLLMVANWSERDTSVNLRVALPSGSYALEVCDGECVREGTLDGKKTFGPEDAGNFRLDLKRGDVLLMRIRPSSARNPMNWF